MKKILFFVVALLASVNLYSYSYKQYPYFHYNFDDKYVFLGNVIGIDTLFNYTEFDKIIGYVCSFQIKVIENFDLDIPDTVWIRPPVNSNDSLLFNIENFVSRYQSDVPRGLHYFRVWKDEDAFYYRLNDCYMGIPLVNDSVYGRLTKINDYKDKIRYLFGKSDKYQKWSRRRFERVIKRKMKNKSRN